jgi:flagellin-like hook-associated protein FlgL
LAELTTSESEINISGCQIVSKVENANAIIGSANSSVACNINITDCTYNSYYDEIGIPLIKSQNANATVNMENVSANLFENNLNMQVGVDGDENSSLNLSTSFFINDFDKFKNITSDDYFTTIDNFLNLVSQKQVQFGAMQNRLESALDEIEIQSSNLISSRSTIRDADMAEISSTYIQQQILQQAAATLMSTANQSPAIALQLI